MNHTRSENAVLAVFQEDAGASLDFPQIRSRLAEPVPDLSDTVDRLVEQGLLWRAGSGRYTLPEASGVYRGRVRGRPSGGALVLCREERIEVSPDVTGGALDGDTVMVRKLRRVSRPDRGQGVIESVVSRGRTGLSGVTRRSGKRWKLDPVNPLLPRGMKLKVPSDMLESFQAGRIIYADLEYSGPDYNAVAVRDIGSPSSPAALIDSVAEDHGFPAVFPDPILLAAEESAAEPLELDGREDFRGVFTITIDPVDAKDFDDAISISREGEGFRLLVHIADVAAYVPSGGVLDLDARSRGTSVYLPDRVVPMIPPVLSNGACSLRPGEERLTRTVSMLFTADGEREDFSILPSVIRSDARLSYAEALEYMEGGGSDGELRGMLGLCSDLSSLLDGGRTERGALDIGGGEFKVLFGRDGWPRSFVRETGDASHRMIENFMVEANRAVADHCGWSVLPVLYRVHDDPVPESEDQLASRLDEMGIDLPGGKIRDPSVLRRLMDRLEGGPMEDLVREAVLRSLAKAVYSPSNDGHFGLALRSYMHFTSPIRRYPDLLVHQVLAMVESGVMPEAPADLPSLADSCGRTERNAETAEREAMELMAVAWISRRTGEVFSGVVSGIKRFGVFVRFDELPLEGLAPAGEIRGAGYSFGASGGPFREGMELEVMVMSADLLARRVTLRPVKGDPGN